MANSQITDVADATQHPDTEMWRSVPSEPGVLASSWGRILLPPSYVPCCFGGYRLIEPKPRYGNLRTNGSPGNERYVIGVKNTGPGKRQKNRFVSRLICEAFHGPPTDEEPLVLHIDENARNNRSSNLKWGSAKENMNAPGYIEYRKSRSGENACNFTHSDAVVQEVFQLRAKGKTQYEIADDLGVTQSWVSGVLSGKLRAS